MKYVAEIISEWVHRNKKRTFVIPEEEKISVACFVCFVLCVSYQIGDNSDSRCRCFSCKRLRVQLLLQFCSEIIQFNMILETCFYVKHFGFSKCVTACVG